MFETAWAHVQANLWLYLSIPITSGLIGWITNVIAIQMMFHPIEFIGVPPYLGWQGIIPRKCAKMAGVAVDTMVPALITEREIFQRMDPQRVADTLREPASRMVEEVIDEVMTQRWPRFWDLVPPALRKRVASGGGSGSGSVVAGVMKDLTDIVEVIFDLKVMVVDTLMRDKRLINRIFQETGRKEFRFIGNSGFYFGFLFGLFQMVGWAFYKGEWQLPIFGLVVGYATNWLALWMIFRPQQPTRYGPLVWQGLFHRRQRDVARDYAALIASAVVTPSHIIESVLAGPNAGRIVDVVEQRLREVFDNHRAIQLARTTLGRERMDVILDALVARVVDRLPEMMRLVDPYMMEAMDLSNTLAQRLAALSPEAFEDMLRPAFKEDEWILIAVGAALGFAVGVGQLILFALFSVAVASG
jgi:uncharacterized membrane protein YheB (UPF0754 family)